MAVELQLKQYQLKNTICYYGYNSEKDPFNHTVVYYLIFLTALFWNI